MPGVHRDTDARTCGATTTVVGQSTVYVNGLLASVKNDPNTHANGELLATVNPGNVYMGGLLVVLEGSSAQPDRLCPSIGPPHCDPRAVSASTDVFVGGGSGGTGGGDAAIESEAEEEATEETEPEITETESELSPDLQERVDALDVSPERQAEIEQFINDNSDVDWSPVQIGDEIYMVSNDYLRDSNGNYIRAGTDEATALAAQYGARLPRTTTEVDAIHNAANIRPPFVSSGEFANQFPNSSNHGQLVNLHNSVLDGFDISPGRGDVVSGQFKTVMDGGIYHGVTNNGNVIQPFGNPHSGGYVDYSQGVRLIWPTPF